MNFDSGEKTMFIKTERLTIRNIEEDDWKAIKEIWTDFNCSEFSKYDTPHSTEDEEVSERIFRWAKNAESTEHMFFAVCFEEKVIGYIAFNKRENGYETGYCFHSKFHGKGFAKESFTAIFEHLGTLGITKIIAGTALDNKPSVALLKSLGFEQTKTEKVSFYKDSEGNDIVFEGGNFELQI